MRGFSLVELMITIAVLAVLLGIGMPGLTSLIAKNRISAKSNELIADLALARSEAIKRGIRTTFCPSASGTACGGTDWSAGRVVFVDLNGDGTFNAGSDIMLRVGDPMTGGATLSSTFNTASPLQYLPSGQASATGSFTVCKSGQVGRTISITLAGATNLAATAANCP